MNRKKNRASRNHDDSDDADNDALFDIKKELKLTKGKEEKELKKNENAKSTQGKSKNNKETMNNDNYSKQKGASTPTTNQTENEVATKSSKKGSHTIDVKNEKITSTQNTEPASGVSSKGKNANAKKKKKNGKFGDESDSDEDPLAKMKALAGEESDDGEVESLDTKTKKVGKTLQSGKVENLTKVEKQKGAIEKNEVMKEHISKKQQNSKSTSNSISKKEEDDFHDDEDVDDDDDDDQERNRQQKNDTKSKKTNEDLDNKRKGVLKRIDDEEDEDFDNKTTRNDTKSNNKKIEKSKKNRKGSKNELKEEEVVIEKTKKSQDIEESGGKSKGQGKNKKGRKGDVEEDGNEGDNDKKNVKTNRSVDEDDVKDKKGKKGKSQKAVIAKKGIKENEESEEEEEEDHPKPVEVHTHKQESMKKTSKKLEDEEDQEDEDEEDDEDEEEEDCVPEPVKTNVKVESKSLQHHKSSKTEKVEKSNSKIINSTLVPSNVDEKKDGVKDVKDEVKDFKQNDSLVQSKDLSQGFVIDAKKLSEEQTPKTSFAAPFVNTKTNIQDAVVSTTTTGETVGGVPIKKSKLELKLEAAKKAKEAADLAAAKLAREQAEAKAEEDARIAVELEVLRRKQEQEAARLALEKFNELSVNSKDASAVAGEEMVTEPSKDDEAQKAEEESRMMSTLYGDEVFNEYGHPTNQGQDDDNDDGKKSGKKLSNKDKRRMQKEEEAKEREKEYNIAAMKASAEGAQFAVSQSIIDPNDPQWQNALDIIIPSLSISAHSKELLINTEFNIVHGRRYGLVAPNGAGKSTLLKMIAARELKVPPRVDFLYVEQEVMADETPAVDAVLKADKVRWDLVQEEKMLLADLEKKTDESKDARLGEIYQQLDAIGAASAESRARRILFGLGFDAEMQIRPTKYFSGGWRMRISLARALFIEPTLLMLDEPTNHLDLNAVIWLDDYLQKWKKTLLVVSHDQDFLNSVCQEIISIDDKRLLYYKGNYDNFKEQEATRRKQQLKDWEKQEKKLRELKAKGITKQNAEKVQIKSKSREPGARSKKQEAAAAATGGLESAESQIQLIKRPRDYLVVFHFPEVVQISPPILEVRDVNFRYGPTLPWLFRGLNFGLDMTSRVCIVGPNGSGKSTIIKLITGEVNPPEGEIRRNPRLRIGVYNQHFVDRLPMEEDPVAYLRRLYSEETYQSCRNLLGKYGLEGHAHTIPIRDLSGGQKARVVFAELSLMAPHLLFLDEPTNNLDIESIDALCLALREYNGGVVLVSHDARLIETTECQLWVVDEQNLTAWSDGFQHYREHLLRKLEDQLATIIPGGGERHNFR